MCGALFAALVVSLIRGSALGDGYRACIHPQLQALLRFGPAGQAHPVDRGQAGQIMAPGHGLRVLRFGGSEPGARATPAHVQMRRSERGTRLGWNVACDHCDAVLAVGDATLTPNHDSPFSTGSHQALLRDVLSLVPPPRPARGRSCAPSSAWSAKAVLGFAPRWRPSNMMVCTRFVAGAVSMSDKRLIRPDLG